MVDRIILSKGDAIWLVEIVLMAKETCQDRIKAVTHKNGV